MTPAGYSLYTFDGDTQGESTCETDCAEEWPPYLLGDGLDPVAGEGVPGSFDVVSRNDGAMQVAYRLMPLYVFSDDDAPGDTNGDGLGGVWHLAAAALPPGPEPGSAEQVDLFWARLNSMDCIDMIAGKFWTSLPEMTREVGVVVLGRPVSVAYRDDRPIGDTVIQVEVDEVLKGDPLFRESGTLELVYSGRSNGPDLQQNLPPNSHILFLDSVAECIATGCRSRDDDRYGYWRPTSYQNVLVDIDGQVAVPIADEIAEYRGERAFPLPLIGRSFDRCSQDIRNAVASESPSLSAGLGTAIAAC